MSREEILANLNKNEDTFQRGRMWYARFAGVERAVPVRMEFDTKFGVVTGYLAELRGRGVDRRLLEGPILPTLVLFSLPMLGGNVLMSLNATVNQFFVAHLLGRSV